MTKKKAALPKDGHCAIKVNFFADKPWSIFKLLCFFPE